MRLHSDEQQSPYNHPSQETTTPKAGYDAKDCIKIVFVTVQPLYKNVERSYLRHDKVAVPSTTLTGGNFAQIPLLDFHSVKT